MPSAIRRDAPRLSWRRQRVAWFACTELTARPVNITLAATEITIRTARPLTGHAVPIELIGSATSDIWARRSSASGEYPAHLLQWRRDRSRIRQGKRQAQRERSSPQLSVFVSSRSCSPPASWRQYFATTALPPNLKSSPTITVE